MLFPPRAAGRSTFSVLLVLCHVLIACVLATDTVRSGDVTQVPLTECTACRDYGSCDLAFRGHPGQFCHTVLWSGLACCCPQDSVCLSDQSSECLCSTIPQNDDGGSSVVWIYVLIVLIIIVIVGLATLITRADDADRQRRSRGSSSYDRRNSPPVVYQPVMHACDASMDYGSTITDSGDMGGTSGGTFEGDSGGGTFEGDSGGGATLAGDTQM
jgi:hypothetical protein